jgi:hypothetical protein
MRFRGQPLHHPIPAFFYDAVTPLPQSNFQQGMPVHSPHRAVLAMRLLPAPPCDEPGRHPTLHEPLALEEVREAMCDVNARKMLCICPSLCMDVRSAELLRILPAATQRMKHLHSCHLSMSPASHH